MDANFIPIEERGIFNYEWHSARPFKCGLPIVSVENINSSRKTIKKHYSEKELKEIAKQILAKSDIAYKLDRNQKRQAIRNIIKDIKSGKIKLQ